MKSYIAELEGKLEHYQLEVCGIAYELLIFNFNDD